MPGLLQDDRHIKLTTPLGGGMLLVHSFRGQEGISSLFHFELDLVSIHPAIAFKDLLGQSVTVELLLVDGSPRYFHGVVRRLFQTGLTHENLATYCMELVPWFWLLSLTSDCRIFQNLSLQEIVSQVFDDLNFTDYEFRGVIGGQVKREYCVQYRESAFNFVSRLLEEEGMFYFFEHSADKHLLVIADTSAEHAPCPGQETARLETGSHQGFKTQDIILGVSWCEDVQSGAVALSDFNFETPSTSLMVELASDRPMELYDYPGSYLMRDRGDLIARLRLEEQNATVSRLEGASTCRAFCPGYRFALQDYFRPDVEPDQVLLKVWHEARQSLGAGDGQGFSYRNSFTSFPLSVPYRPPRSSRKPVVNGTQTAIVVGKSGEEIWTDKYGRVKVQFHWDRRGQRDENSSCWIRVAHQWAGKNWGSIFTPRLGQEVIVDFLEGDPDRPIIVGRVYNAEQMPPYELPTEATKSTIKSDSSKGGGGFNELRFEDKASEEEIFLHAQKDFNIKVLNNHSRSVDANESIAVGGNRSVVVKGNQNVTVQGAPEKGGDEPVEGEAGNGFSGSATSVTGKWNVSASDTILITAPTSITLQCGGSSIVLTPGAITLSAGDGSKVVLDANALTQSSAGSKVFLDANALTESSGGSKVLLDANALAQSSGGSKVLLDANALAQSSGGSKVLLDGSALAQSSGGSKVLLNGDALMQSSGGSKVKLDGTATMSASGGGKVVLDAGAKVSGANATVSGGSSLALTPATAELKGSVVKLN